MLPKKSMNRITLINIFSTVLLQGISMLTAPVISRLLGTENYGIVSIYNTWVPVVTIILGLQAESTLNLARTEYPEEEQKKYQSSILAMVLLSFLVGTAVIAACQKPLSELLRLHPVMVLLIVIQAYGSFCITLLNCKLAYEFKADKNLLLSLVVAVLSIGVSVALILSMPPESNYWGRVLGLASVYGCFGIGISIFFFSRGRTLFHKAYWKFCLPLSLPLIVHSLAGVALGQSDRIMLQQMCDEATVGIYSLAAAFASVMSIVWSSLNNSWVPFFYEFSNNKQIDEIKKHGRNYLELYSILAIGFMLLTPEVYKLFASQAYWSGTSMIPLLVLGYYFVFLYSFPANYEFYNRKTKATAVCTLIAGACNIGLNLIFIRHWGVFGAALATMAAHGVQFLVHYFYAMSIKKGVDFPFRMKLLVPYVLPVMAVTAWTAVFPGAWWLRWGVGAVLGVWELLRMLKRKSIF